MRWRDRFLFVAEACYKAQAETGRFFAQSIGVFYTFSYYLLLPLVSSLLSKTEGKSKKKVTTKAKADVCNWMNCKETITF
jgi:hypothetical protein